MRSYLSLIPISAKVHRRQSRMTRVCIILAVFLVTSIFSMAEMWMDGELAQMRRKHGDWHIALQNLSEEDAEQIRGNDTIAFCSWHGEISQDIGRGCYINGRNAVVYGVEETYTADIMNYQAEGRYPQGEKEAALSVDARELLGVEIGDCIALNTPAGDLDYTITGFYVDDTEFNSIVDGIRVYLNRVSFDELCGLNGTEPVYGFYIRFRKESGLKKAIADVRRQYNPDKVGIVGNKGVLGLLGADGNRSVNELYPLAACCFVIILIAGVFMISSCMNSNVAQRTRFFGMMRCLGASRRQLMRFVRLEALNWCKTAIPIGCASGTVTCWVLCVILKFLVKGEWTAMPLFAVSAAGIASGAAVGLVTVFFAAHFPAKQAARVSPIAALSGGEGELGYTGHEVKAGFFKIETSLGIHHAAGAKKNLFLMTGSFALTIVLFLAFSACLDFVHKLLPAVGDFAPDIVISGEDEMKSVSRNLVEEISGVSGVGAVFGIMLYAAYPVEINGSPDSVDLYSYDGFLFDRFKKSIVSGDLAKVYGDCGYAMAIYNQDKRLNVGDKIKIGQEEMEIAAVASEGVGSVSGSLTVVCSEETYTRLTGVDNYTIAGVLLAKDASEATVNKIRYMADGYSLRDNRDGNREVYGSYWVFRLAAYGFLAIVSFITVLNIMNSVSMGVSARIRQYGAMRAVGMENRQITKMIAAEAAAYAVGGTVVGIILGLLLHHLIYEKLILSHFGGIWQIPLTSIVIVMLLVAVSCAAAVYAPAKRIRNMAIAETINEL